jgi:hypothetical protein
VAKRGRPPGSTRLNLAVHHANGLIELWLADAPVIEIRVMLSSLAGSPKYQALIEECWSKRGSNPRTTAPKAIKEALCRLAIAHVMELRLDTIERQCTKAAKTALLIKTPDIEKVLEGVNRKAPEGISLRRKKRRQDGMADAREEAWREMVDELTSAWRGPR